MLRRPANIELFTPDIASTKVENGLLYIKGMPPISADNVIGCNLLCPATGTAEVVVVAPVIAAGCDCPFTWDLTIMKLPDLLDYGTDQTFERPAFYNYEAPNGATPTQAVVAAEIVAQINADPQATYTAAVTGGGSNEITITGKTNGHIFTAFAPSSTITVSTYGTSDALTATILKKMFPIQVGVFGQTPAALDMWCGCNCLLKVKVQFCCEADLPSDAKDIDMDRALLGHEYEFVLPIPCTYNYNQSDVAAPTDPTVWDEPFKSLSGFFTCLVAAS